MPIRVDTATSGRTTATTLIDNLFVGTGVTTPGTPPQGSVSLTGLDDSPTLFHLNFPVYAVAKFRSPELSGHFGIGTGIMFYDVGDEVGGGATWPILFKAGFQVPITDRMSVGLDGRFHYALTTPSDVDSILGNQGRRTILLRLLISEHAKNKKAGKAVKAAFPAFFLLTRLGRLVARNTQIPHSQVQGRCQTQLPFAIPNKLNPALEI